MVDQVVQITAGSGTKVQVFENTIGANVAEAQGVVVVDSAGAAVSSGFAGGFQYTTDQPRQIFYDPFDAALDTTNNWTTPTAGNSATLAAVASGVMTLATGTTASGWSKLFTAGSFRPVVPAWIGYSSAIALPDGAAPIANSYRFWGAGTPAATPTTAAPLTDAVGFELATDGKMYAVVYASGTRTVIQDLSAATGNSKQPVNTAMHRYIIYIRTDKAFWYIDGISSGFLVGTSSFQAPAVQTLPQTFLAVGGATPPATTAQIQCSGTAVWDTGKNTSQIADGAFPWRKATVKPASTAALTTDTALVVALSPNNPAGQGTAAATAAAWPIKITDGTSLAAVKAASTAAVAADPASVVSLSPNSPVTQAALTKGTQGSTGITTQHLKDAGRNNSHLFMVAAIVSTATDALQSLTGYKSGAAVTATTTPAVVTTGKTYRVTHISLNVITSGSGGNLRFTLRANTGGVVAIGSPAVASWNIGHADVVAGVGSFNMIPFPDGMEFPAGTGLGISVQGFSTTQVAAAVGYAQAGIYGYEY